MVSAPGITHTDIVVEIGPGKGALTGPLLETGAKVVAFELDGRMIEFLQEKFTAEIESGKLQLVHGDVLEMDLSRYVTNRKYKVVANIPYYITNLIIRRFLSGIVQPSDMCLLIQKEVAERIVTRDNKTSILSLSVDLYGTVSYVMKVGRQYFNPSPKVDSAVISIAEIHRERILDNEFEKEFFSIIKTAFGQKRKQTIKNLSAIAPRDTWEKIFTELAIPLNVRSEDIDFQHWFTIVKNYRKK